VIGVSWLLDDLIPNDCDQLLGQLIVDGRATVQDAYECTEYLRGEADRSL